MTTHDPVRPPAPSTPTTAPRETASPRGALRDAHAPEDRAEELPPEKNLHEVMERTRRLMRNASAAVLRATRSMERASKAQAWSQQVAERARAAIA